MKRERVIGYGVPLLVLATGFLIGFVCGTVRERAASDEYDRRENQMWRKETHQRKLADELYCQDRIDNFRQWCTDEFDHVLRADMPDGGPE